MSRPIYLIGFPGCGKTTIGQRLAEKLNKSFIDLDVLAVQSKGFCDVASFVSAHSMASFRKAEAKAVKTVSSMSDVVIACGGATPCFKSNWEIMKATGLIVYLHEPSEYILWQRLCREQDSRSALRGFNHEQIREWIKTKLRERLPIYEQADVTIPAREL